MADGTISLRALAAGGGVQSWAAPYFHVSRVPPAGDDPAIALATTVVQVLNPGRDKPVEALLLFWDRGQRLEDLTKKLTIPVQSLLDYRPFVSEGSVAGWVSVTADGPIIPGGWIDELRDIGGTTQLVRVPLGFQPHVGD